VAVEGGRSEARRLPKGAFAVNGAWSSARSGGGRLPVGLCGCASWHHFWGGQGQPGLRMGRPEGFLRRFVGGLLRCA